MLDVDHLVGDLVLAEDWSLDDLCGGGFADVCYARGEDGVAVVGSAIFGKEANQTLKVISWRLSDIGREHTVKEAIANDFHVHSSR